MKILAIETSDRAGSIALSEAERCLISIELPVALRSAQSLAPTIKTALANAGWRPRDVQLVAIANGPGSFTGVRVGVVTAKTFAYAVGGQMIAIDTLSVIAEQADCDVRQLSVVIDAHRNELFTARFERMATDRWTRITEPAIVSVDGWLAGLTAAHAGDEGIGVSGPALAKLAKQVPAGVEIVNADLWRPMASTVARLAWRAYQAGHRDDIWSVAPLYLRKSAAEEKAEEGGRGSGVAG